MPCRSDYMEPTAQEAAIQKAAQLYLYAAKELGHPVPAFVAVSAGAIYAAETRVIPELCEYLRSLTEGQRDKVMLKKGSKPAAELNVWWLDHLEADKRHKTEDQKRHRDAKLRASALAKLTPAERKVLGHGDV